MSKNTIKNLPLCNKGGAYLTLNGQNRNAFEVAKLDAKVEIKTWSKQRLGRNMEESRATGAKGSGTVTVYNATSIFREALQEFLDTGNFPPLSIQAYANDESAGVGRLEVLLSGVIPGEVNLLNFDEDSEEGAKTDMPITFSGYKVLNEYHLPVNY